MYRDECASQVILVVKHPPAKEGDIKRHWFDLWLGKIPWEGNGYPLHYSCLESPRDSGAWWAIVHRVSKSQTQLKQLSLHAHGDEYINVKDIHIQLYSWSRFLREDDFFLIVFDSTIKKSKEFLRNGYLVLRLGSLCYNIEQLSPQNNKYFDYLLKSLVALKYIIKLTRVWVSRF